MKYLQAIFIFIAVKFKQMTWGQIIYLSVWIYPLEQQLQYFPVLLSSPLYNLLIILLCEIFPVLEYKLGKLLPLLPVLGLS